MPEKHRRQNQILRSLGEAKGNPTATDSIAISLTI